MHSEDEAKKLWCPMTNMSRSGDGPANKCAASFCAMWRWSDAQIVMASTDRQAATLLGKGYEFTKRAIGGQMEMKIRPDRRRGFCGLAGPQIGEL